MSKFEKIDLSRVRTISIHDRERSVEAAAFARPVGSGASLAEYLDALPDVLAVRELRELAALVGAARRAKKPVIMLMGAHVVKVGLSPIVVDLMQRGVLTAVGMNSAAAIHDVETALFGITSEDVAANIADGSFGMSRETGEFINTTLTKAHRSGSDVGYAEALGDRLLSDGAPNAAISILAAGCRLGVPVSVHAAIGTDVVHQQPTMDGAATGELSLRDFRLLARIVADLGSGGVALNVGSAVILPEVFLKALTVARNLGHDVRDFSTANFDFIQHYRPRMNIVTRPTAAGGRGFQFTGHHELLFPLFVAMIGRESARA